MNERNAAAAAAMLPAVSGLYICQLHWFKPSELCCVMHFLLAGLRPLCISQSFNTVMQLITLRQDMVAQIVAFEAPHGLVDKEGSSPGCIPKLFHLC